MLKKFYFEKEKELKPFFDTDSSFRSWITSWHAWNRNERQKIINLIEERQWEEALQKTKVELRMEKK